MEYFYIDLYFHFCKGIEYFSTIAYTAYFNRTKKVILEPDSKALLDISALQTADSL